MRQFRLFGTTEDMFLDHFKTCKEAQRIWAERHGRANNDIDWGHRRRHWRFNFYLPIL